MIDAWRDRRLAHVAAGSIDDRRRPRGSRGRGVASRSDDPRDGWLRVGLRGRVVAVRAELAVEQHVAAHAEHAVARAMAVAERRRAAAGGSPDGRRR